MDMQVLQWGLSSLREHVPRGIDPKCSGARTRVVTTE
jgi:hypothetical protein